MHYTSYGHSCFSVVIKGKKILFDPFITYNELARHIDVDSIEADYIFLSHAHEDHIADCISIASRTGAKVVCSFEIHVWLNNKGITNTHPMNTAADMILVRVRNEKSRYVSHTALQRNHSNIGRSINQQIFFLIEQQP